MPTQTGRDTRRAPTLDYLHSLRTPSKTSMFDDTTLLTLAIQKSVGNDHELILDPDRFTAAMGAAQIPTRPLTDDEIKAIEPSLDFTPFKYPEGNTFREQVESVLPQNPDMFPLDSGLRDAVIHLLQRLMVGLPSDFDPCQFYPGLDPISSSLFALSYIAREVGTPIRWPQELYKPPRRDGLSRWRILTIRPDGALSGRKHSFVDGIRSGIRALRSDALWQVIDLLRDATRPVILDQKSVSRAVGVSRGDTKRILRSMEHLVTERFLISMQHIGLRHRCIFSKRKRLPWPIRSLYEHIELSGSDYLSARFYLEPIESEGPDEPLAISFDAHTKVVSFRMDLFNRFNKKGEEIGTWSHAAMESETTKTPRPKGWLYKTTSSAHKGCAPSEPIQDLLSILWTHRGSARQRMRLLSLFEYPGSSWRTHLHDLIKSGTVSFIYHPSLEYCALPDGILVAAWNGSRAEIDDVGLWLCRSFAYVRLLKGDTGLVAVIRLHEGTSGFLAPVIGSEMDRRGLEYFSAVPEKQSTYYMTALGRLYSPIEERWRDPWET
ncbi:MAG: hypothetical protein ACP6KW_11650 [Candidatus Thorarchaeota archaeon]